MTPGSHKVEDPGASSHVLVIGTPMQHRHEIELSLRAQNITPDFAGSQYATGDEPAHPPDLVIINLDRLTSSAPSRVSKARRFGAPIICCFPREEADNVLAVEQLAVDDYLLTPFHLEDFNCRVRLLLHKNEQRGLPDIDRRHGERRRECRSCRHTEPGSPAPLLHIDDRKKLVFLEGREIHLTPKEYSLFTLLASNTDRVLAHEEIIKHIWPAAKRASVLDLQQFIHLLRKKVEVDPKRPKLIVTVHGFGYQLDLHPPAPAKH